MSWLYPTRTLAGDPRVPYHLTKSEDRTVAFRLEGRSPSPYGWQHTSVIVYVRDYDHAQDARNQIPHMRVERTIRMKATTK